jgi:hypothetical protein
MNKLIHYLVYSLRDVLRAFLKTSYTIILKAIVMTTKNLLIALTASSMPKGELRLEMFNFYNSMVGKSKYFPRSENPKTACGSCIQRVKTSIWKWYHSDETAPTYKGLVFTGRLAAHNIPVYVYED